jgi:hypothetical protein
VSVPWEVWMGFITQEEHDERLADHPGDESPYTTG